jgi:hypothetical protein
VKAMDGNEGESGDGVTMPDNGERSNSRSPSDPRNSSNSFLRLLVLFAGGVITSSGKGGSDGVGGVGVERVVFSQAGAAMAVALTTRDGVGRLSHIAVAAWLWACQRRRWRRLHFPPEAAVAVGLAGYRLK